MTPGVDGFSAAVTEDEFERMQNDPRIRVTDHTGMGPMSEFDVFLSWGFVDQEEDDADECPYCWGEGKVKRRYGTAGSGPAKIVKERECPLCGGTGTNRIEEGDDGEA